MYDAMMGLSDVIGDFDVSTRRQVVKAFCDSTIGIGDNLQVRSTNLVRCSAGSLFARASSHTARVKKMFCLWREALLLLSAVKVGGRRICSSAFVRPC